MHRRRKARLRKRENDLKKTEAEIEKLETRDGEIDEEMAQPEIAVNVAECVRLSKEKAAIEPVKFKSRQGCMYR